MKKFKLPDEKVNALLGMAGKKLGKNPDALREQLQSGDINGVLGGLDKDSAAKVQGLLSDPKALENLLKNEQLQQLISNLGKK
jgi:hypothetical protein